MSQTKSQPLQNLLIPVKEQTIHSNLNLYFSEDEMFEKLKVKHENFTGEMNPQSDESDGANENKNEKKMAKILKHSNGIFKRKTVNVSCSTINTLTKNSQTPRIFRVIEIKLGKQTLILQDNFTFVNDDQKAKLEEQQSLQSLQVMKRAKTSAKYHIITRSESKRKYRKRQ